MPINEDIGNKFFLTACMSALYFEYAFKSTFVISTLVTVPVLSVTLCVTVEASETFVIAIPNTNIIAANKTEINLFIAHATSGDMLSLVSKGKNNQPHIIPHLNYNTKEQENCL